MARTESTIHDEQELILYIENDYDLYMKRRPEFLKNMQRKIDKGAYRHDLAPKLWRYFTDEAARKYRKEFGRDTQFTFDPECRQNVAESLADEAYEELQASPVIV